MALEFEGFPKIPRYYRKVCIAEKIDGTNAQILLTPGDHEDFLQDKYALDYQDGLVLYAGSRKRYLRLESDKKGGDNFGFAQWVSENSKDLFELGRGRHFGEWWGAGIQRGYASHTRKFSLFNIKRWGVHNPPPPPCRAVPLMYDGPLTPYIIDAVLEDLKNNGSRAKEGFLDPEGIIIWHYDTRSYTKNTFRGNRSKWESNV